MIDVKKLREMAASQRAADSELNNSTPLTDTTDTAEPLFQDEVFVPIAEESYVTDYSDAPVRESLDSIIARCFDEKAYNIELERLIPFRKSIFTILGDISELKSDIARVGITEPLLVRSAGNGEYEILSGTRRRAAAEELMWTKVPCRIGSNAELTDDCAARIVVETNSGRFSTLALSEQIRVAAVLGESAAAELGISPAQAEGLNEAEYVIYEHFTRAFRIVKREERLPVELPTQDDFALYVIVPYRNGFAPIGLCGKFLSPKTIASADGETVRLKEGGTFAFVKDGKLVLEEREG